MVDSLTGDAPSWLDSLIGRAMYSLGYGPTAEEERLRANPLAGSVMLEQSEPTREEILANSDVGRIVSGGVINAGNALTGGLMDEGAAAGNAAIDYMLGKRDFGPAYEDWLQEARERRGEYRAAAGEPLAMASDIIAGSLLPINLTGKPATVSPLFDSIGQAIIHPTTGPSLAKLGALGGLLGAGYGFGEGEGGAANRLASAGVGAGTGAVLGAGIPAVAQGLGLAGRQVAAAHARPEGEAGAIVLPTLSRGQLRNIRGPGASEDLPIIEFVRQVNERTPGGLIVKPEWDTVANLDEAIAKYQRMKFIDPVIVAEQEARYSPITIRGAAEELGDLYSVGNQKMAHWNPTYPGGRNTIDFPGCGRGKYCSVNELPTGACYGGSCYADAGARARGMEILQNVEGGFFKPNDPRFQAVVQDVKKLGVEGAQQKYIDQYRIAYHPDTQKVTVRNAGRTEGARVPLHIKEALNGQDLRLGVDSDASAFLSDPRVMDAILASNPKTVTAYSSAYHTPPPPHPLAGRTMINVTVSGWHPLPETLKRLEWARQARANGWNVILRNVTADPETFTPEVLAKMAKNKAVAIKKGKGYNEAPDIARFNRLIDLVNQADFYAMEQPLHMTGGYYGKSLGLPACCVNGDCSNCLVSEGIGKGFRDYWGIQEDQPLFTDYPNYLKGVDARTKALVRFGGSR